MRHTQEYNFATWDNWAKTTSFNKNIKVYIGAPASPDAAGTGYVNSSTLAQYVSQAQSKYSSFGGVMMWDMDTAFSECIVDYQRQSYGTDKFPANGRFDLAVKNAMVESAIKLGFSPRKPTSSSSSSSEVHATQTSASATPKAAPSTSHPAATSTVRPTTVSVHTSATVTSVVSVAPQPTTVTDEPEPVSSVSVHRHRFRPHETINAAASIEFEKWEHEMASFRANFRPSATDTPAEATNDPH